MRGPIGRALRTPVLVAWRRARALIPARAWLWIGAAVLAPWLIGVALGYMLFAIGQALRWFGVSVEVLTPRL